MSNPVAVITGASAGIGEALAGVFAARGHATVLVARRQDQLEAVAQRIGSAGGPVPHVLAIDLAQPGGTDELARRLAERGLDPAILVNNAGFGLRGAAANLDRLEQLAMIDLNVRVLTDLSLRFVESLGRHRGGIINLASVASYFPGPGMAVYYATKAYVLSFTEALSRELAPVGIRVTAVCPGPVPTEFQARAGLDRRLPPLITVSTEQVAREAYEGFMRGKRVVIPGLLNKFIVTTPRLIPRALLLRLMEANQMRPARRSET
ncbi:MAG TPA: SDR family oxidoreductase [Xanthobacteraceae bacterium]